MAGPAYLDPSAVDLFRRLDRTQIKDPQTHKELNALWMALRKDAVLPAPAIEALCEIVVKQNAPTLSVAAE